jgi:hypothetical protein
MKTKLILLFALMYIGVSAVKAQRPWKEYLVPGTLMFLSGLTEGTNEALAFHYRQGFKRCFPGASDQFWDPSVSWKNKYKNNDPSQGPRFPGSTEVFVAFTDGYHMMRTSKLIMDMGALTYCANSNHKEKGKYRFINWKTVAQDFIVLSALRTIGFHVTYSWMFANPSGDIKY